MHWRWRRANACSWYVTRKVNTHIEKNNIKCVNLYRSIMRFSEIQVVNVAVSLRAKIWLQLLKLYVDDDIVSYRTSISRHVNLMRCEAVKTCVMTWNRFARQTNQNWSYAQYDSGWVFSRWTLFHWNAFHGLHCGCYRQIDNLFGLLCCSATRVDKPVLRRDRTRPWDVPRSSHPPPPTSCNMNLLSRCTTCQKTPNVSAIETHSCMRRLKSAR